MSKIVILGAGIMATAMTSMMADNGHEVALVGTHLDREVIDSIKNTRVHPRLELKVPDCVTPYQLEDTPKAFADADIVVSGVNSFGVHWVGQQFKNLLHPGQHVLCVTKGMEADEQGNLRILPEVVKAEVGEELASQVTWSAVVGPAIAGEVAVRHETCVVFASENAEARELLAKAFRTPYYHVWTSSDLLGCEVGAATKNVYAFAAGLGQGLMDVDPDPTKYGRINYGAALFAQGATEMHRFFEILGGAPETVYGLPGVGDMYVTSMGGRNVKAGRLVGAGVTFSEIRNDRMKGVTLEGVAAISVIGKALKPLTERGIVKPEEFPLLRHLYEIVEEDKPLNMPWEKFFGGEK